MGVTMRARYEGRKKCSLAHEEGAALATDAPRDIGGDATAFSPTDLVGAALASCVLTTMAMWAERNGLDLSGATARVEKEMVALPTRRIARLPLTVRLPASVPADRRGALEQAGRACPVCASLHPEVEAPITFVYE